MKTYQEIDMELADVRETLDTLLWHMKDDEVKELVGKAYMLLGQARAKAFEKHLEEHINKG